MKTLTFHQNLSRRKKIRIAHIVNTLAPAGKEIGIIKLLNHLNKSRFETYLFVFSGVQHFEENIFRHMNIIHLGKREGNDIRLPFKLASYFSRIQADIVHTHSWGTLVEGILGARLSHVPIVIHGEHGTFPNSFLHLKVQRFFWGLADVVLSVSANLRTILSRSVGFPRQRIEVIINGVEDDRFFPSAELDKKFREKFGFSSEDFIVGTVGRMSEVKNQQMIIRAIAHLNREGHTIQCVLIGDGEKKAELRQLAESLNVQNYVHFLGYQKDVNMMLNGMDVFVLTSFSEGCSNVIQEAMFVGKPVVATDVGGNSELVRPGLNGYLVQSNNHRELAEKLKLLKDCPELRATLGKKGYDFARKNFSVQTMVEQYSDLYIKLYEEKILRKQKSGTNA